MARASHWAWAVPVLLLTLVWAPPGPAQPRGRTLPAGVLKIVSGDTLNVFVNGQVERVRLIGIVAPDPNAMTPAAESLAREGRELNRRLLEGQTVRLELDAQERDAEGSLLAYVWLADIMVNAELVAQGYAQAISVPPNVRHQTLLMNRQREARARRLGLWRESGPEPPERGGSAASPQTAQGRPGAPPRNAWSCPLTHPIKGNFITYSGDRCIYYLPGAETYTEIRPERCYATEAEARSDGCRGSKN